MGRLPLASVPWGTANTTMSPLVAGGADGKLMVPAGDSAWNVPCSEREEVQLAARLQHRRLDARGGRRQAGFQRLQLEVTAAGRRTAGRTGLRVNRLLKNGITASTPLCFGLDRPRIDRFGRMDKYNGAGMHEQGKSQPVRLAIHNTSREGPHGRRRRLDGPSAEILQFAPRCDYNDGSLGRSKWGRRWRPTTWSSRSRGPAARRTPCGCWRCCCARDGTST